VSWFLPGLLLCVVAQAVLLGPLSLMEIRPDLFLVLVILVSRRSSPETATLLGFVIGLCQGALSGAPLGLHAFTNSLMAFVIASLSHHLYTDKPFALLWFLLAGSGAVSGIRLALLTFFLSSPPLVPALLRVIIPETLYTAAVGLLILSFPQVRAALARTA
jgi:rod shape-determining protein MreD